MKDCYVLLDSGDGRKLEQFGPFVLSRPCGVALWRPSLPQKSWCLADASFSREGGNRWTVRTSLPKEWSLSFGGVRLKLSPTEFGHLGVFPEHSLLWEEMRATIRSSSTPSRILNLFAYSGGATLAAAQAGASVCHLDASKGMVAWARENALANNLTHAPIRWIVDDALKFLTREVKRGSLYEGIVLDPPSFGRGNKGEVFQIEKDLLEILNLCRQLLSPQALFILFSSHTPGMTPLVMHHLLTQTLRGRGGSIDAQELIIPSPQGCSIPCGSYATWRPR